MRKPGKSKDPKRVLAGLKARKNKVAEYVSDWRRQQATSKDAKVIDDARQELDNLEFEQRQLDESIEKLLREHPELAGAGQR